MIDRSGLTGPDAAAILYSIVGADLVYNSFPIFSGTVTCPLWGHDPNFQVLEIGDDAVLWLPTTPEGSGMIQDPNFPWGLDDVLRVVSWQANCPDQGDQTIDITLNAPPNAEPAQLP
jgi:hypothetical protein